VSHFETPPNRDRRFHAVQAKTAIAELAESVLRRIGKVIGGGSFSRSSPFRYWYEDVRARFLAPPLGTGLQPAVSILTDYHNTCPRPCAWPGLASFVGEPGPPQADIQRLRAQRQVCRVHLPRVLGTVLCLRADLRFELDRFG
jgi:hypothetical protein